MRRADWKERLWQELEDAKARPFAYGVHDCVQLTARCLDAMLEEPRFVELVGRIYSTGRQALRLVMREGLEELVTRELGAPAPRLLACQGDVCLAELERGPAIGICVGPRIAFAGDGVTYRALECAEKVWLIR
jgi:hypothetical protein